MPRKGRSDDETYPMKHTEIERMSACQYIPEAHADQLLHRSSMPVTHR